MAENNEDQPIDEIPLATSIAGAKILGVASNGDTNLFSINDIKGDYKGLAEANTDPGGPALAQVYDAQPGVTYANFLDSGGQPITIPLSVGNDPVLTARLVFNGTFWQGVYNSTKIDLEDFIFELSNINEVNLINDDYLTIGYVGSGGNVDSSDTAWRRTKNVPVQPGQDYVFTATNFNVTSSKNLNFYTQRGDFLQNIKIGSLPFNFVAPENSSYFLANIKEDGDEITPSLLKLYFRGDYNIISEINAKEVAASNIKNNDSTRRSIEKIFVAGSNVKTEKTTNLFDNNKITIGYVSGGGTIENSDTEWRKVLITNVHPGSHTLSTNNPGVFFPTNNKNICFFNKEGAFIGNVKANVLPFSFSAPEGVDHIYMNIAYVGDGDNMGAISTAQFMLNRGGVKETYQPFKRAFLNNVLGYKIGFSEMVYSELKLNISASNLIPGEKIIVRNAPGDKTIVVTANSAGTISKNIEVVETGTQFDFYQLDISANVIFCYDNLACVIRNTAGTWAFINDTDHSPKGFASVSQNDDSVILNYIKEYTRVKSLVATPDETYTQFGVYGVGASVGLDLAALKLSCEGIFGEIKEVSGALSIIKSGFNNAVKAVNMAVGGEITVVHSQTAGLIAIISSNNPNHFYKEINTDSLTQTKFKCYDSATGNQITTEVGLDFTFNRPGGRLLKHTESELAGSNVWVYGLMCTEIS